MSTMPPLTQDALPWYQFLSIDLLLRVSKATFLSPILCWLYPLALRAQAFHWHMRPLQYAVAFAVTVDIFWFLCHLDSLGRNGRFSRTKSENDEKVVEEVDDVVVVTGGSSGLGQIIAEIFALKGISVAILDIKKPQMEENYALQYYECDVSDVEAVKRVGAQITKDVRSPPSPLPEKCKNNDVVGDTYSVNKLCSYNFIE
jgi:short chain dehydrogenase